jgi:hypothetical protein
MMAGDRGGRDEEHGNDAIAPTAGIVHHLETRALSKLKACFACAFAPA